MKNFFTGAILFLVISAGVWAGGASESETSEVPAAEEIVSVSIAVPTGAPAVSIAQLAAGTFNSEGYEIAYEVVNSPDLMGARLVSGEADIAIVPTNLAARLYNQGQDIRIAGAVVWGIIYIATTAPEISTWEDLVGRNIGIFGRGLTPDLVFRNIAMANGLDPDADIQLNYYSAATELAPALMAGKEDIALLPEPALSMVLSKNPQASILFDLQDEWAAIGNRGSSYPQAVIVVRGEFLEGHRSFVEAFLTAFDASIDSINSNPQEAGIAAAAIIEGSNPSILAAAIPRMKLDFVDGAQAEADIEQYLSVLLLANSQSLSGELPDSALYGIE